MTTRHTAQAPLELWGGVECTVNRVGDTWFDQVVRSGHHERLDDLDRFAALGLRVLRYPALWERMAPRGLDAIDWRWTDERFARMQALGIRPIVGLLHHGSGPGYTSLVDERFPEQLAQFAAAVAGRYPWVTDFTPVNEPLTTARFSGLYGHWYPHGTDATMFIRAMLTQMRGIVLAMRAIRTVTPGARLIQTEDCGRTFGTPGTGAQVAHEEHRRWLTWDLLTGRVDAAHPLWQWLIASGASTAELEFFTEAPCPPDVLGLNYYLTSDRYLDERLDRYPSSLHGGNGTVAYADLEAVRARDAGIAGHQAHVMEAWARYRRPLAITEVHLACSREEQLRWFAESWQGAQRARACGADVTAVTAWALLGSFDWNSLVTRDAGHYEPGVFDLRAPSPRPTALAAAVQACTAGGALEHPVLDVAGWWRRPERMVYRDAAPSPHPAQYGQPLLVVGAPPPLASVLRAACALRGLGLRLVSRRDYDLNSPATADAMLRKLQPWAVLDVMGGALLTERLVPRPPPTPATVVKHVNLAAACRRRGIALAAWSSATLFDGGSDESYGENEPAVAASADARLLAETERRVRDVLPAALVIRTGVLFGSADGVTLGSAPVSAEASASTSGSGPSGRFAYVPHAVDALLDLLIDGETGVWHLANGEAASADAAPATTPAIAPAVRLRSVRGWPMPGLERALADHAAAVRGSITGGLETCVSP